MLVQDRARLEIEIGCYILDEIYGLYEFDIIDCFDACMEYLPANYVPSRECYLFSSY